MIHNSKLYRAGWYCFEFEIKCLLFISVPESIVLRVRGLFYSPFHPTIQEFKWCTVQVTYVYMHSLQNAVKELIPQQSDQHPEGVCTYTIDRKSSLLRLSIRSESLREQPVVFGVNISVLRSKDAHFDSGQGNQLSREIFMSYLSLSKRTLICATATFFHVVSSSHLAFENRDQCFPTTVLQYIVRVSAINRRTKKYINTSGKPNYCLKCRGNLF
jgi:hypothetical protein